MDDESNPAPEVTLPPRKRPDKRVLTAVISLLVIITIGNFIANATLPALIKDHPALLIFLSPTTRNLLLVSAQMSLATFLVLAILRRMVPHPLWFMIGRWYGQAGIDWVKTKSPETGQFIDAIEKHFPKFGWLIVMIWPTNVVCVVAGASSMSFLSFIVWTWIGIFAFVILARLFGDFLTPVTKPIADFSGEHWLPLTIITVGLVVASLGYSQISGRNKLETVGQIEAELDREAAKQNTQPDGDSKA